MILLSCVFHHTPPKYGVEFNEEREKIGLPLLNENWEYVEIIGALGSSWINPARDKSKPSYFSKSVSYNNDTILWESDHYVGLKEYNTIDGKFQEELYVIYHFTKSDSDGVGWKYVLSTAGESDSMHNIDITKEIADSILISWGLAGTD
jgi:hypothetical protein